MAELATLSRPYANAVFDLAQSSGNLESWSKTLNILVTTSGDTTVQTMLDNPDMAAIEKAAKLAELCEDEVNDDTGSFLYALAEHDRLSLLSQIQRQFEALRAEQERILDVEVVSAFDLTQGQSDALKAALQRKYEKDVALTSRTDTSLIGGAVIRAGDMVVDGSVRGRLTKLVETLLLK